MISSDIWKKLDSIYGWLDYSNADIIAFLLTNQASHGDVLEIGIEQGKTLLTMVAHIKPEEVAVGVDLFESQEKNISKSGFGNRAGLDANIERFLAKDRIEIVHSDSLDLKDEFLINNARRFRFVHIDGGHDRHTVLHDLNTALAVLQVDGIVVIDDWFRPELPEVTDAVYERHITTADIHPICLSKHKIFLAKDHQCANQYRSMISKEYASKIDQVIGPSHILGGGEIPTIKNFSFEDTLMTAQDNQKRILLVSMVKNESKVIGRMVSSARPFVDAVFICDTGSEDDTIEQARLASGALPFSSALCGWKDFSFNRTEAIWLAKEEIDKHGWDRASTWLLLIDGDQTLNPLKPSGPATKDDLTSHDIVQLKQRGGNEDWTTPRCIRASVNCRYVRRTHEYLDHDPAEKHNCQICELIEHSDGGCRSDKFIRDEKLLRMDLAEMPDDARTLFYLARTLRDLGRVSESRELYRRRVAVGGWDEERWMAQLQLGRCFIQEGALLSGRDELWRAFGMRPWRAEPLFDLAKSYVDTDRWMACRIAERGKSIPYPAGDALFIERSVYQYEFTRIISICSYYIGEVDAGLRNSNELRIYSGCAYHDEAIEHLCWYASRLKSEWIKNVPVEDDNDWHPCNPSIIKTNNGYLMSVRTVNYKINKDGGYYGFCSAVQTRTHLVELDDDLIEARRVELQSIPMNESASIKHVEDVRLYRSNDGIVYGLGTRVDGRVHTPRPFSLAWDVRTGRCVSNVEVEFNENACEKNWLPWQVGGLTRILYSHSPFTTFSMSSGVILDDQNSILLPFDLSGLSGSAAPIPWRNGWLYVAHECTRHITNKKRTYLHRFCWMDENFYLRLVGLPFYFEEKGIEFCSGIAPHGDGIVITYGINDAAARVAKVSKVSVNLSIGI